jgi:hypothetical protein
MWDVYWLMSIPVALVKLSPVAESNVRSKNTFWIRSDASHPVSRFLSMTTFQSADIHNEDLIFGTSLNQRSLLQSEFLLFLQ